MKDEMKAALEQAVREEFQTMTLISVDSILCRPEYRDRFLTGVRARLHFDEGDMLSCLLNLRKKQDPAIKMKK